MAALNVPVCPAIVVTTASVTATRCVNRAANGDASVLIVGESGQIMATIRSVCVVISGLVEGDIHASEQIVLHKTAVVNGDLDSPMIVMEEGAQLNGCVRMGKAAGEAVKPTAPANAKTETGSDSSSDSGSSN